MYVVRVVPITRGVFLDELTFFSKESIEPGMVVEARVNGRPIAALVSEVRDVREEKTALKTEDFALKKLDPSTKKRILSRAIITALTELARYHGVSLGSVFAHLIPSAILNSVSGLIDVPLVGEAPLVAADRLVLQAESEERIRTYRNVAREAFARNESVMLLAPTIAEAERLGKALGRGIESQILLATSALSKKAARAAWNRAIEEREPLLAIVTPTFLTLPRKVSTLIVERESARSYTPRERPFIDARIAAEYIARASGARIVFADFPLRVETRYRLLLGELEEAARSQVSMRVGARVRLVNMKEKKDDEIKKKKRFSPLSDYAKSAIERELARGGRVFIHAARRGIAPLTVCNDCGTPVLDPTTGTPMTLQKTPESNIFVSARSGAVIPAETPCRTCGGWNLVSLGIGIERIEDEVRTLFPEASVHILSAETAPTHTKAKKISAAFFASPRTILIGTDRAIPYLDEPVDTTIVSSLDAMLAAPPWRAHEYALHTLFTLRDTTLDEIIIQTRTPDALVARTVALGNTTEFFEQELTERKRFSYPPFATFIGLSWSGTEAAVTKISEIVGRALNAWDVVGPLPPRLTAPRRYTARAIIRLPKGAWPEETLTSVLKSLPPDIAIAVDPDEIV